MHIDIAKNVFELEMSSLNFVKNKLDDQFNKVVDALLYSSGRVVVCGMGKSGHIGKKIYATFVSTGTPSIYLHPAEAFHGDLGVVLKKDIFLALSNSGETEELVRIIPFLKDNGNMLVSLTGNPNSTLATSSDYHIDIGVDQEACPLQLAPTSSTTSTLVMGDAIAVALMKARNFQPENFARFHPGGALGRKLLGKISEFMLPAKTVGLKADIKNTLTKMTQSSCGMICVTNTEGKLEGVITDGDIRRALSSYEVSDFIALTPIDLMTSNPLVVTGDMRCSDADNIMAQEGVNGLVVVGKENKLYIYHNLNRGSEK